MERNTDSTGLEVYGDRRADRTANHRVPDVLNPLVNRMPSPMVTRNMMRRQADTGLNLVTILALVIKRRRLILSLFVLLFIPVAIYVVTAPRKYEAELKLVLKKPITGGSVAPSVAGEAEVAAEIELLKGRELYEQIVRESGMAGKLPDRRALELAVKELEANLKIQQIGKTSMISLRNTAAVPETAAMVPNRLAELYLRKHIEVNGSGDAASFFNERTAHYQRQLDEAQRALAHFRQTGDVSLLNEQKQAYLRRATDLTAAIEEAEGQIRDSQVRVRTLAEQRNSQPLQVETGRRVSRTNALAERLKGSVLDLQNRRAELLTKYDPQYRLVKEVEQQLADTKVALERELQPQVADSSQAPNPLRLSIEAESLRLESQVGGLQARRDALTKDLAEYRERQSHLESLTANHNDLERSVKIAEENYLLYQRKLEEARLGEALDQRRILNVAILEKAAIPALPATQHRAYLLLFGFLAAGFGALASAFLTDYLERNLPAKSPVGGQRASDRGVESPEPAPQYFRRREPASVVEVESTTVPVTHDAWRELFDRRSRAIAEAEPGPRTES